jgi:phospholipid/cholesterol/gamma-HCH transport system substrate-binding protein
MAKLKEMGTNPGTPVGVLTQNQEAGTQIKALIKNLEGGSEKLAEDLEAVQHNFLLRGFFKKKAKKAKLDSLSKK